jgi:hypothetical protein
LIFSAGFTTPKKRAADPAEFADRICIPRLKPQKRPAREVIEDATRHIEDEAD